MLAPSEVFTYPLMVAHHSTECNSISRIAITDLVIRDNSLAAATAGRSFWVLDDLSAIQQSGGEHADNSMQLFAPKENYRLFASAPFFLITEQAYGKNPSEGVALDYYLDVDDTTSLTLEILDENGMLVRKVSGTRESQASRAQGGRGNIPATHTEEMSMNDGVNRWVWDFRSEGLVKIPETYVFGADYRGHRVAPGTYTAARYIRRPGLRGHNCH